MANSPVGRQLAELMKLSETIMIWETQQLAGVIMCERW